MNPILKNILAVVGGWIVGSVVNMGLINTGHKMFPIVGIDINDMTALAEVMPTLDAKHFLFPFLGHALGTLVGAFLAYKIAATNKMKMAMIVGVLFFLGGIMVNYMITGPMWFTITDIVLAYFPMAWLGAKFAKN